MILNKLLYELECFVLHHVSITIKRGKRNKSKDSPSAVVSGIMAVLVCCLLEGIYNPIQSIVLKTSA